MRKFLTWLLAIFAVLAVVATLVSLLPSDQWFVRTIDLVREPIIYAAFALALLSFLAARWRGLLVGAFMLVIAINLWRMWPYLPIAPEEIDTVVADATRSTSSDQCFTALAVNVKVKNDQYDKVAAQITRASPDLLLLMETDEKWVAELQPVLSRYGYVLEHPQAEAFGMVFASRLPVAEARMVENTQRDTPTLYATVNTPTGQAVEFIGLHPKPPLPGWDTDERDASIVRAGTRSPQGNPNGVIMGDFNDVPWSRTTTRLREAGDWRDPRIGRGAFPTFPANRLWLGWPLDQIMVRGDVTVRGLAIMPDNSSDHRAVHAVLCAERGRSG